MKYNNYFNHILFPEVNMIELKNESKNYNFKVMRFEKTDVPDGKDMSNWFTFQTAWHTANVKNVSNSPNVKKIIKMFEDAMEEKYLDDNDLISSKFAASFFLQKAKQHIIMHDDLPMSSIALNIKFEDDTSPITFEDIGDVNYKSCLLNVIHRHEVRGSENDRMVFRMTPYNQDYQYVCEKLDKMGYLVNDIL